MDLRQFDAWLAEFGMDAETLFSSLCHARFDILAKTDSGTKIDSPKGYFYNTAKRYGGMYPPPKDYKPLRLINAEMTQQRRSQEAEAARIEADIGEIPDEVKALTGWMPKSSQKHPG